MLLGKSLLVTLVTVGLFFAGQPIALVALVAAGVLLLGRVRPEKVYNSIDWPLLVMFAGLFVVVNAFEVNVVRTWGLERWHALLESPVVLVSGLSVILSNLVSNVPAVLLFKPLMEVMPKTRAGVAGSGDVEHACGEPDGAGIGREFDRRRKRTPLGYTPWIHRVSQGGCAANDLDNACGRGLASFDPLLTDRSERDMDNGKSPPSRQSSRALDVVNFLLADVRDGLGPYLAIYLSVRHFDPAAIGIAMSAMGVATVAAQTPAGALIDRLWHKRLAIVAASLAVGAGSLAMVLRPMLPVIVSSQVVIGIAAAVFPPAVTAISLGLVGHAAFARRTGRNEAFNHAGNVAAAILAGVIGDHVAYEGIFYLLAAMCVATMISILFVRKEEIDHDLARGSNRHENAPGRRKNRLEPASTTPGTLELSPFAN